MGIKWENPPACVNFIYFNPTFNKTAPHQTDKTDRTFIIFEKQSEYGSTLKMLRVTSVFGSKLQFGNHLTIEQIDDALGITGIVL